MLPFRARRSVEKSLFAALALPVVAATIGGLAGTASASTAASTGSAAAGGKVRVPASGAMFGARGTMKRIAVMLCLALVAGGGVAALAQPAAAADEFDTLRSRWDQVLTGGASFDPADPDLAIVAGRITSKAQANWGSLNKADARTYLWSDMQGTGTAAYLTETYGRIRSLVVAYRTLGSPLYGNVNLRTDAISALDWMYSNRYNERLTEYGNWWDWEIGVPSHLNDMTVMLYDDLTATQRLRYLAAVNRFSPVVDGTGANLVWKASVVGLRAVIVKDGSKLAQARDSLSSLFPYVSTGDGFYRDGSYVQHLRNPATGSYGNSLVYDLSNLLYLLSGSSYAVTDPGINNVYRWVYDSFEPLMYKGALSDAAMGRVASRYLYQDHVIGNQITRAVLRLSQFAPAADALNYRRMAKEWILSDAALNFYVDAPISYALLAKAVVGDPGIARRAAPSQAVVFAGMDRSVQQRPGYAFAVSMHSDRIYNFESINNENLRGWHQGDGATFLHNGDQTQFSDGFWPTVNPSRLPGITAEQGTAEPANTLSNQKWVGGSALNGYSATGMALHTPGQSLSAYKSWFAFDNEIVALGTGINATDGKDVQTIVENRKSPGTLTVNGASKTSGIWGGVRWAQLSGVGYYFPGGRTVTGLRETRYGRWSDINTQVPFGNTTLLSRYYQSLAIDHGVNPRNGSYSYALLPDRTASQTGAYAATPQFSILRNDATAQAVKENTIGVTAANIYSDGGVSAGWIWSARKASIVLQVRNGRIDVSVSDPTRLSGTFEVRIARSASTVIAKDPAVKVLGTGSSIRLSINTTGLAGRSVHASFR